jgi:hypothetical protein
VNKSFTSYIAVRTDWIEGLRERGVDCCWICGDREQWYPEPVTLEVEHITHGRAKTRQALCDLCTFFRICAKCHRNIPAALRREQLLDGDQGGHDVLVCMLAIKQQLDPGHFDLARLLKMYGYSRWYVTADELAVARQPAWLNR